MTGTTHKKSNDTAIASFTYTYGNAANRPIVTENSGDVVTWTYDNTNQLTGEQRSRAKTYEMQFTYDNVGNRATMAAHTGWAVSEAGTAGCNGNYAPDGTYNSKTAYKLDASHYLVWEDRNPDRWELQSAKGSGT